MSKFSRARLEKRFSGPRKRFLQWMPKGTRRLGGQSCLQTTRVLSLTHERFTAILGHLAGRLAGGHADLSFKAPTRPRVAFGSLFRVVRRPGSEGLKTAFFAQDGAPGPGWYFGPPSRFGGVYDKKTPSGCAVFRQGFARSASASEPFRGKSP